MSACLQAEYLAEPFRYSAAGRAFCKKGQLKWTWNKLWCPIKNSEILKNYLCQGLLWLSARWRIFQFRLPVALPQYYQIFFKCNIIVISPFMDLTLHNRWTSVFVLFLTTLELLINCPRVSLTLFRCCWHKKPPSIRYCWDHCPVYRSVLPQSCTPPACRFQLLSHIVNTSGKRVLLILSYTTKYKWDLDHGQGLMTVKIPVYYMKKA